MELGISPYNWFDEKHKKGKETYQSTAVYKTHENIQRRVGDTGKNKLE